MSGTDSHTGDPVYTGAAFNPLAIDDDDTLTNAPLPAATTAPTPPPTPGLQPQAQAPAAAPVVPTPSATPDLVKEPTAAPAAAPEPATEDDTAAEVAPEDPADQLARERAALISAYAARRRRYTWAVLGALALGLWLVKPWSTLDLPSNPLAIGGSVHTTTQSAHPARDLIATDMAAIHRRLHKTGDVTGMKLPGAQVASAGTSLYAARNVDGQCVVYGVADGHDIAPAADATGQACAGQIADVQTELDAADAAQRADAVTGAEQAVADAMDTAGFYASQNFRNGHPSLVGLPPSSLGGATVVTNHGDWAQLQATYQGTCRTGIVAADGGHGEITAC